MATTNRPSPATKNAAFAVLVLGIAEERRQGAIVVVPGVSTSSIARGSSAGGSGFATSAICWFAA